MRRLEDITEAIASYNPEADSDIIRKAYVYSAKVHHGQVRLSGEPYLSHPIEVSYILTRLKMDAVTTAVGLLHDTLEDTHTTPQDIERIFGKEILSLVDGVTKISKIEFASREEQQAENFRKMILAMAEDIRVILIKLADRAHNMRTLEYISSREKQKRIAMETLDIYAPISNRLGIGWLKSELEDSSFKYLYPEDYKYIESRVESKFDERDKYIKGVANIVSDELKKADIVTRITGRPKYFYSIFQKMQSQNISFDEVYDLAGLRIITDTIRNCYAVLGIIHSIWKPIHGKIKDYIAMPKANMYQSLHTTVIGPDGERVEFQIRTEDMHNTAEEGIAAHWRYKEKKIEERDDKKFLWLRHLLEWQQDLKDPKEFMETVKIDLFPDEVYVFTPKGDVKGFPRGATPIDFAYQIHTDVGNRCVGAKINGKIVPLKYKLKNGDIIEILTSSARTPSRDWLKIVKTSRAKTKIRAWIKNEQKQRSIALGKEICEKEIQRYDLSSSAVMKPKALLKAAAALGFSKVENLMAGIGYGKISVQQVMARLIPEEKILERKKREESKLRKIVEKVTRKPSDKGGIKVKGVDDILIRFGKCCNPIPGDDIIGFITRGRGISVHIRNCPSIADIEYDPDRRIDVEWDKEKSAPHLVQVAIVTVDKPGLLAKISSAIAVYDVNISNANIQTTEDKKAYLNFSIEIRDIEHLKNVIKTVERIKGVISVKRVKGSLLK